MLQVPSLSDFQSALFRAISRPLNRDESMTKENAQTAEYFIKPNSRLTSFDRLQIYNQQYWWRLLSSLADDFSGLQAVLGEKRFQKLAVLYLQDCGSVSWNLRDLGSQLETYIGKYPELVEPYGEVAIEMVRVEWARIVAFDGLQKPLLDGQKFAGQAPDNMRLELQEYITLLKLQFPVDRLLKRLKQSESNTASNALTIPKQRRKMRLYAKPAPQPIYLVVHRVDLQVYYKHIEPEAFLLLSNLSAGLPLEAACAAAFSMSPQCPEEIVDNVRIWFSAWMSLGWLCERQPTGGVS